MPPPPSSRLASVNGQIMPARDAPISATEKQLTRGNGAIEVIRIYDGRPFALQDHLRRLQRSASQIGVAVEIEAVTADAWRLLAGTGAGPDHELLRIVVTRRGGRLLLTEPLPPQPKGIRLASVGYAPARILGRWKSQAYAGNLAAGRVAAERGFDGALLVTSRGAALGSSMGDLFWVDGEDVLTLPLGDQVLPSITRTAVIELVGAREERSTPGALAQADEAFLCSTIHQVQPITAIDATPLLEGPVTAEAAAALDKRIQSELATS